MKKTLKDFKITNTYDTSKEFTLDNAAGDGTEESPYTWTLEGVPVGTTVEFTEIGYTAKGYNVEVKINKTAVEGEPTAEATVADGAPTTVAFTNTYEQKLGSVKVTKVFSGLGDVKKTLKDFKITNTYDTSKEFTLDNAAGDGTEESPYTWTLEGVPVGTTVEFTEIGYTAKGYNVEVKINKTAVEGEPTAEATVADGDPTTVAFTNTYEQKLGSVKVTKVFSGLGDVKKTLKDFKITNTYDTSKEFTLDNAAGDGTEESPYTWTLEGVPVGTTVEFTEIGYTAKGYNVEVKINKTAVEGEPTAEATVADGDPTTVAFTNTYEQKLGNVEVTKVFSGVKGLPDGFQITNDYNEDVFTLENASGEGTAENPYKWTIKNVPDETEITFTESGYDVTGYDVTINGQATTDAETGTVKATIAENETAIAKFTNEYTPTKRDIEISKVDLTRQH